MNFLVVDSNRLFSRLLTTYLISKGHTATPTENISKTPELLEANKFDAVIIEPFESDKPSVVLEELYAPFKAKGIPIVVFTSMGYDEERMRASQEAGGKGWIAKGLGLTEIYSKLTGILPQLETQQPSPKKPQR